VPLVGIFQVHVKAHAAGCWVIKLPDHIAYLDWQLRELVEFHDFLGLLHDWS